MALRCRELYLQVLLYGAQPLLQCLLDQVLKLFVVDMDVLHHYCDHHCIWPAMQCLTPADISHNGTSPQRKVPLKLLESSVPKHARSI